MRTVLVGAVETSLVALEALGREDAAPIAVLTLPMSKSARHSDWTDLRPAAARWKARIIEAPDVNAPEVLDTLGQLAPDYAFVIGWSQICRAAFLDIPELGAIGYHPAPLPENRGRAVVPWTILQRRADTGATLFWMDEGMDSGDILVQQRFPVAPDETARSLYDKHLVMLSRMLSVAVAQLRSAHPPRVAQDHGRATYCARRVPVDGMIDWASTAESVWTLIRAAGDPYPGAFSFHRGHKLMLWEAEYLGAAPYWGVPGQVQALAGPNALVQCGDGNHVLLRTVQRDGEERSPAAEVLRTHDRLGVDWLRLVDQPTGQHQ